MAKTVGACTPQSPRNMATGIAISICNCINVRLHCFGRTFLQSIRESCKVESASAPPTVNSGYAYVTQFVVLLTYLHVPCCCTLSINHWTIWQNDDKIVDPINHKYHVTAACRREASVVQ